MKFQWDPKKAAANLARHGVSFKEASTVFGDPLASTILDPDHSVAELRLLTLGRSVEGRLVVVSHTDRGEDIRIISARPGTRSKKKKYEQSHKETVDDMRTEYDFSGGVRGKYFERYKASTNIVVLDPDISLAFPNAAAVNDALRVLVGLAGKVPTLPKNRKQRTSARSEAKVRARR